MLLAETVSNDRQPGSDCPGSDDGRLNLQKAMQIGQAVAAACQKRKEVKRMSEKEKKTLETILTAVPKMSEFQKGRLYGFAEAMEESNKKGERKDEHNDDSGD